MYLHFFQLMKIVWYLYWLFVYNFWLCFCNKCISESKFWWMKSHSIAYWKLEILSTDFLAHIFEKESWANFVFLQRLYYFLKCFCFFTTWIYISSPPITRNYTNSKSKLYTLKPWYSEQVRQTLFVHYIE